MIGQAIIVRLKERLEELEAIALPPAGSRSIEDVLRYREIRMLRRNLKQYRAYRDRPDDFIIQEET